MLLPCEIAVKCLIPSVRAMTAQQLITKYNLKQIEAAKLLGISQPAISLYNRKMRGKTLNLESDEEIKKLIEKLAASLAKGNLSHKEYFILFCEICRTIRAKGLLCEMHKTLDPAIATEKCELCLSTNSPKCI